MFELLHCTIQYLVTNISEWHPLELCSRNPPKELVLNRSVAPSQMKTSCQDGSCDLWLWFSLSLVKTGESREERMMRTMKESKGRGCTFVRRKVSIHERTGRNQEESKIGTKDPEERMGKVLIPV